MNTATGARRGRAPLAVTAAVLAALAGLAGLAGLRAAAGAADAAEPVSDAEARAVLAVAVDQTLRRDFEALCASAGSVLLCEGDLRNGAQATAPRTAPEVVRSYELVPDGDRLGGRVLVVRGVDGQGSAYESQLLVTRLESRAVLPSPVFWEGVRLDGGAVAEPR